MPAEHISLDMTDAQLDALIAERMKDLPLWWEEEGRKEEERQRQCRFGWLGVIKRKRRGK